ncbi:MAG TPA: hypothetical protein VGS08_00460 [Candidatus Saccharimonadales bacterium]|nr:hypothetical protein [Candidatus Saccharimonadales bacterium]
MGHIEALAKLSQKLAGVLTIKDSAIEELREILEAEQDKPVTQAEAKAIGESLITTFKVLAGNREILGVEKIRGGKQ